MKQYREEGRTSIQKKCRERMLAYWKRVKAEKGDQLRELSDFRTRQREEKRKLKLKTLREKKLTASERRALRETTTKYRKLKERMDEYWRKVRDKEMCNLTRITQERGLTSSLYYV
uniref:Uncharacterized protein n=1 Tax=Cacopsylla melanoneura TaxID=428564 RepID=A0A8D8LI29_9HEMI